MCLQDTTEIIFWVCTTHKQTVYWVIENYIAQYSVYSFSRIQLSKWGFYSTQLALSIQCSKLKQNQ